MSLVALPGDLHAERHLRCDECVRAYRQSNAGLGARAPFHIEIVGEAVGPLGLASRVPISVQREINTIETSDIVIVPSVLLGPEGWEKGRYPRLVDWLRMMYDRGCQTGHASKWRSQARSNVR